MPRRISWKELITGLLAAAAITMAALAILVFARVGTLHGSTFPLFAQTGEARNVIRGTEVWMAGQKVGVVKGVRFLSPNVPERSRVLIVMEILEDARAHVRRDTYAQIRAGFTLIGAPVVHLSVGTTAAREVADGDTIRSLPQADMETMSSEFALASRHFPEIISNVKLLDQELHGVEGTLGALAAERGGAQLPAVRKHVSRVMKQWSMDSGTIGQALARSHELTDRASRALARTDSVRQFLGSDRLTLGRLRRDSTLFREIDDVRNELDLVRARLEAPNGTLSRARRDSALVATIDSARREMTLIVQDMRRHPLRYLRF